MSVNAGEHSSSGWGQDSTILTPSGPLVSWATSAQALGLKAVEYTAVTLSSQAL